MVTIYNVDFSLLSSRFLNIILRKLKLRAWVKCLATPIQTIHSAFLDFRIKTNEDLTFNSQTMLFEFLLNKKFNNGNLGIWIDNIASAHPVTDIFTIEEEEPIKPIYDLSELSVDVRPTFIYSIAEYATLYDFVVNVPYATLDITAEPKRLAEMKALILKYKFAGKRFTIKNY